MEPFFGPSASLPHGDTVLLEGNPHFPECLMDLENTLKRRRHLNTHVSSLDEYYGVQIPEKKRRLTPEQANLLEQSFESENKLEPERKAQLAKELGISSRQVAVWFQNRRARWKTKQLEKDYDILKCSYDSLLSNYELIARENDKLKSEVVSLTEKLKAKEATAMEYEDPLEWWVLP